MIPGSLESEGREIERYILDGDNVNSGLRSIPTLISAVLAVIVPFIQLYACIVLAVVSVVCPVAEASAIPLFSFDSSEEAAAG